MRGFVLTAWRDQLDRIAGPTSRYSGGDDQIVGRETRCHFALTPSACAVDVLSCAPCRANTNTAFFLVSRLPSSRRREYQTCSVALFNEIVTSPWNMPPRKQFAIIFGSIVVRIVRLALSFRPLNSDTTPLTFRRGEPVDLEYRRIAALVYGTSRSGTCH